MVIGRSIDINDTGIPGESYEERRVSDWYHLIFDLDWLLLGWSSLVLLSPAMSMDVVVIVTFSLLLSNLGPVDD